MSDVYSINLAKTAFREGYDTGDVSRLMSVFQASGFTNMSEGRASKYGMEALSNFRAQAQTLFAEYSVKLTPIVIAIVVMGNTAYDYGWHEFTFTPKNGEEVIRKRQRYFELWSKNAEGDWKISLLINNSDVKEEINGFASSWFLSAQSDTWLS